MEKFVSIIYKLLFGNRSIYFFGALVVFLFLCSTINRYIYIDDAAFGEEAFYLSELGYVKIPSLIHYNGGATRLFVYHKLLIFTGALLIKLFGFMLNPMRIATALMFSGLLYTVYKYVRGSQIHLSKQVALLTVFLLACNPLSLLYAYTFRPEIWVTFFGFISWMLLSRYRNDQTKQHILFLSGATAGIAFLYHLNGLAFIAAGGLLLLTDRKIKPLFLFSSGVLGTGLFYFYDLWQPGHMQTMLYQLHNWPDNVGTNYNSLGFTDLLLNALVKLTKEHQRFFWSYKVWATSGLFLLSLIFFFQKIWSTQKPMMLYLLFLIISLNIVGSHIAERYLIYFLPFMSILTATAIVYAADDKTAYKRIAFAVLFILQFTFVGKMAAFIFERQRDYVGLHHNVLEKIPEKDALTLVPHEFIFNTINEYDLVSFKGIEYDEIIAGEPFTRASFFEYIAELNVEYVVLPGPVLKYENTAVFCLDNGGPVELAGTGYMFFYEDENALILRRENLH